ncbi:MAG: cytochrome oxidase small assembly protein [Burkholderiaceae bacterium]
MTPEQNDVRKRNRRLGLILASIAIAIFVGFVFKSAVLGA